MPNPQQNNVGTTKTAKTSVGRNVRAPEKILVETDEHRATREDQREEAERIAREHPSGASDLNLPERDARGVLTRAAMEKIVSEGGSVLIHRRNAKGDIVDGKMAVHVNDLPTEADLSEGDPDAEEAALRALDERQRTIEQDRIKILTRQGRKLPARQASSAQQQQTGPQGKQVDARDIPLHAQGQQSPGVTAKIPPNAGGAPLVPTEGEE